MAVRIDEEPDDFEGLLRGLAESLRIDGALDLYEPKRVELPATIDLLECRIRMRGQRVGPDPYRKRWRPEPAALDAAVESGIAWCLQNGASLPLTLQTRLIVSGVLGADDAHEHVHTALGLAADLGVVKLTSVAPDRFRTMAVSPSRGRITLIEGGTTIQQRGWQATLEALIGALREAAPWAVYGFIKRGSKHNAATLATSLGSDWVAITRFNSLAMTPEAFEDKYAPDAFGVQLLGPGYHSRTPQGSDWRATPVETDTMLVEHIDPDAWFDGTLVPFGGYNATAARLGVPVPDLVKQARSDFEAILLTEQIILTAP